MGNSSASQIPVDPVPTEGGPALLMPLNKIRANAIKFEAEKRDPTLPVRTLSLTCALCTFVRF